MAVSLEEGGGQSTLENMGVGPDGRLVDWCWSILASGHGHMVYAGESRRNL